MMIMMLMRKGLAEWCAGKPGVVESVLNMAWRSNADPRTIDRGNSESNLISDNGQVENVVDKGSP